MGHAKKLSAGLLTALGIISGEIGTSPKKWLDIPVMVGAATAANKAIDYDTPFSNQAI